MIAIILACVYAVFVQRLVLPFVHVEPGILKILDMYTKRLCVTSKFKGSCVSDFTFKSPTTGLWHYILVQLLQHLTQQSSEHTSDLLT